MARDEGADDVAAEAVALAPVGDESRVEEGRNVVQEAVAQGGIGLFEDGAAQNQAVGEKHVPCVLVVRHFADQQQKSGGINIGGRNSCRSF